MIGQEKYFYYGLAGIIAVTVFAVYTLPYNSTVYFYVIAVILFALLILSWLIWNFPEVIFHPKASKLHTRGWKQQQRGNYKEAMATYDEGLSLYPRLCKTYINQGLIWAEWGNYDAALSSYAQAINLNCRRWMPFAYINRSIIYFQQSEFEKVIADCNEAIRLNPKFSQAYLNRAAARLKMRDFDNGILDCYKVIRLRNHRLALALAYNNLGMIYILKGEVEKAIGYCNQAVEIDPSLVNIYNTRGQVYFLLRKFSEALSDFKRAAELKPDNKCALASQAISYSVLGETEQAKALWKVLINGDDRFGNATWLEYEFDWTTPLIEEALKLTESIRDV